MIPYIYWYIKLQKTEHLSNYIFKVHLLCFHKQKITLIWWEEKKNLLSSIQKKKKCLHVIRKARMLIWPADKLNILFVKVQWSDNSVGNKCIMSLHRALLCRVCWDYLCSLHHGTGHLLFKKEKCVPSLEFKRFFLSIKSPPLEHICIS